MARPAIGQTRDMTSSRCAPWFRVRACAVLVVVAVLVLAGCSGDDYDVATAEREIGRFVDRTYEGIETGEVTCPDDVDAKKGTKFDCTAEVEGQDLRIAVTMTDDDGNATFEATQAVLDLTRAEEAMGSDIGAQIGATVAVDCGERDFLVKDPGDTFECEATDEDGNSVTLVATVTDADGHIEYETVAES